MGKRTSLTSFKCFDQAVVAGTTYYTEPINVRLSQISSFQAWWEGVTNFNLKIETSNDPRVGYSPSVARWSTENTTFSGSEDSLSGGSTIQHLGNLGSTWIRLKIDPTTAGTVTVLISGKD